VVAFIFGVLGSVGIFGYVFISGFLSHDDGSVLNRFFIAAIMILSLLVIAMAMLPQALWRHVSDLHVLQARLLSALIARPSVDSTTLARHFFVACQTMKDPKYSSRAVCLAAHA
jgi:hypothetical protein